MAAPVFAESRYDPRADLVEALDARLGELVRSGAPLRRALARVAGAFVARKAWEPLGFVRAGDHARERPGLSGRELHELAHVDAALAKLPAIDAAFSSGRLGWTKARLLCRAATPEDEARWLEAARRLSAAALAREVRAVDLGSLEAGAAEGEDEPGGRDVLRIRTAKSTPSRWGSLRCLLRRLTGEWLPNETCVELIAAEVLSAIRLDEDPDEPPPIARRCRSHSPEPPPAAAEPAASAALPPSLFVEMLVAGLEDADPRELDRRLCRAAALERGLLARIGTLLFALSQARGHFDLGFRSLDAYARERLGMSARKARALLRVERASLLAPAFGAAWHSGELTSSQAQILVPLILAPGSEPFHAGWIERAAGVTVRRLGDDVDHALASGTFDPALLSHLPNLDVDLDFDLADEVPEGVQIGARHRGGEETMVWVQHVPADVARLFRACLCSVARRFEVSPGTALRLMFLHCLDTWWPKPSGRAAREQRVFARDGWRCTVPGCTSYRNLHAHHVTYRSRGGSDEDANLTTLCAAHHQRGVHAGVLRITGRAPDGLVFELPLGRFRSGDRSATMPP